MCLWFVIIASNIWTRRAIIVSQRHLKTYRHSWSFIFSPYSFEKMAQAPAPAINWVHVRRKETPNSFLLEHSDGDGDRCFCLPWRSALYLEQFMQSSPEQSIMNCLAFHGSRNGGVFLKQLCRRLLMVRHISKSASGIYVHIGSPGQRSNPSFGIFKKRSWVTWHIIYF